MTTSPRVLDLVAKALMLKTSAKDRVQRPGDLPTQSDQYPMLKLRLLGETRQSPGRGTIQFTTLCTVRVTGEVSAPAKLADPTVSEVEARLWRLKREIEMAVIGSYPLFREVQQLASVNSQLSFDAQATQLAGIQSDYTFEIYEAPEDFAPIEADVLDEVDLTATEYPSADFTANLQP